VADGYNGESSCTHDRVPVISGMSQPPSFLPGRFRRAVVEDRATLAALAFRSKALWGYGAEFMERARPALIPSDAYLTHGPVYVLEQAIRSDGTLTFEDTPASPSKC
jgi:hypothetical protein